MNFVLESGDILSSSANCIVIGVQQSQPLTGSSLTADKSTEGLINELISSDDFKGKKGETLTLHRPTGLSTDRLILIGLGSDELSESSYIAAVTAAASAVKTTPATSAAFFLSEVDVTGRDNNWKAQQQVISIETAHYVFDELKGE